ncbi:MAG TPA: ABC transporter permease [Gemmatales bacterium]|nr:ABC transporter permease [Gemmatales bacterium]
MSWFDSELWSIIALTMQVAIVALAIASILGVPAGLLLGLTRFPGKRLLIALVYTGMALPPVVVGLVVYIFLSRSGPLAFLEWLFTPSAMILAQTVMAFPLITGLVMNAVTAVPSELVLQIRSLGATAWQEQWTILREVRAGVMFAVLVTFGRIISEVGAALIVGGNIQGHTRVLSTAIVLETGKGNFALALALGGWLVGLALLVNLAAMRLQKRPMA